MPKNKVNNNLKLKNGGGILNGSEGLYVSTAKIITAGESINSGDAVKIGIDGDNTFKGFKVNGQKSPVQFYQEGPNYGQNEFESIIPLTENRYVLIVARPRNGTGGKTRRAVCIERQSNGTFLAGTSFVIGDWDVDDNIIDFVFAKRINDNSFMLSLKASITSNSQGTPRVIIFSVSNRTITASTNYSFGITSGGNNSQPHCIDAINLSGNNWLFYINGNYSSSNYMKIFAGQVDPVARTITVGSASDLTTSAFSSSSFLLRLTDTEAIAFYGTSYRHFSVNFASNAITYTYAAQTDPVQSLGGTRVGYLNSLKTDAIGVCLYRSSASIAIIASYSVTNGVIALAGTTLLTASASSSESIYRYDWDAEMFLINYTTNSSSKTRRVYFKNNNILVLDERASIGMTTGSRKKQEVIYHTLSHSGPIYQYTSTHSIGFYSLDYDQHAFIAESSAAPGGDLSVLRVGDIFTTTGLIPGAVYYLGQDGSISRKKTETINSVTYENDILGTAINDTQLLLKK